MTNEKSQKLQNLFRQVSLAKTNEFLELARIAEIDPIKDLTGANLSGTDLRNINLSGADLSFTDFSNANLSRADLSGANLTCANLDGADLNEVNLIGANLSGAIFQPLPIAPACPLTLFMIPVAAGFPSPAEDYIEAQLDLNQYLIRHQAATFFVRASGDSMLGAAIHSGDLLIVDRAIQPADGNIVIAVVNGELTVKRLSQKGDRLLLVAENEQYAPLEINKHTEFHIWGVVTNVIHSLC
jgi:DNA polymerase V